MFEGDTHVLLLTKTKQTKKNPPSLLWLYAHLVAMCMLETQCWQDYILINIMREYCSLFWSQNVKSTLTFWTIFIEYYLFSDQTCNIHSCYHIFYVFCGYSLFQLWQYLLFGRERSFYSSLLSLNGCSLYSWNLTLRL